jgi:hypothetical protein
VPCPAGAVRRDVRRPGRRTLGAKTRLLYSFEDGSDVTKLTRFADGATLTASQDNGVTEGKKCARLVVRRGVDYGSFRFDAGALRNWADFDYFAVDVTTEDEHAYALMLELWDSRSRNYAMRCTYEG